MEENWTEKYYGFNAPEIRKQVFQRIIEYVRANPDITMEKMEAIVYVRTGFRMEYCKSMIKTLLTVGELVEEKGKISIP